MVEILVNESVKINEVFYLKPSKINCLGALLF